jgi:hypothetical protein
MNFRLCVCGIAAAGLLLATAARSEEKKGKAESTGADKPGAEHKKLARLAGEYNTVSRFRAKPEDAPLESKGTAKITSVLDGRFLLEENTGTQFGQPYKGVRLVGYNNATKQYEASWTYSMSTAIMTLTGTCKGEGKPIEWKANFTDENGEKQTLYVITRKIDADQFVVELFGKTADGKRGPTVETTYTRKK